MRASVESVPDMDHQHGDDDYEDMDYGENDYGDMEGGEIDGVGREVRGSEDSLAGFFRETSLPCCKTWLAELSGVIFQISVTSAEQLTRLS
jgi:hypothetical protein